METGKVWVVCGANEVLGVAAVQYLILRGQQVVAIPAPGSEEEKKTQWYNEQFPLADLRFINLFDAPDTEKAVHQIVEQYGRIDKLINIGDSGLLSMHVLTVMQHAGKGHIIQMTVGENGESLTHAASGLRMEYDAGGEDGIRYTFLGPDLCFQSMLTQKSIGKTLND